MKRVESLNEELKLVKKGKISLAEMVKKTSESATQAHVDTALYTGAARTSRKLKLPSSNRSSLAIRKGGAKTSRLGNSSPNRRAGSSLEPAEKRDNRSFLKVPST